jgi:diguanylate cyclase (GGDEF)-like protein
MQRIPTRWLGLALGAVTLATAAFAVWLLALLSGTGTPPAVADSGPAFASLVAAVVCAWAAAGQRGRGRLAWSLLAVALLSWSAGSGLTASRALGLVPAPPYPLVDLTHQAAALLTVAACLLLLTRSSASSTLETVLDAMTVVSSLLFISWATVLGTVYQPNSEPTAATLTIVADIAADVAILSVAFLLAIRSAPSQRFPNILLAAGVGAKALADSSSAYLGAVGGTPAIPMSASLAGGLLVVLAGLSSWGRPVPDARPQPARSQVTLLLPYIPVVAVALTAIGYAAVRGEMSSFLLWNLIALGLLVFARQVAALLRNFALTQHLEHQLRYDALTGLPNRFHLREQLQVALDRVKDGASVSLLLMDLDHFKRLTDTVGEAAGDGLLKMVGARLQQALHGRALVARIGGDEFAALSENSSTANASQMAKGLLRLLGDPFVVEGQALEIGCSIGVAVFPEHGKTADDVLRRADMAMYAAKESRHTFAVYEPSQDEGVGNPLAMMAELRAAIRTGQLVLEYQPIVDTRTGAVSHVEALVRWHHPQRGIIPPGDFIPFAEDSGLIGPLTEWVIGTALRQTRTWHEQGTKLGVAVNISMRNLLDPDLDAHVAELIQRLNAQARWLRLEITESAIMSDPKRVARTLARLRGIGVGLSVDDFGTGYSSLAHLQRLPVDEVKVDRSFVASMISDHNSAAIVRAALDLGRNLRLITVAEGVENQQTADLLMSLGCDSIQGFYVSRPLPEDRVVAWLAEWQGKRPAAAA